MKKTLIAGTVMALLSHGAMAANDWRFAAGADLWNAQGSGQVSSVGADGSYDENYNWSGYLQLEHGILLLPTPSLKCPTSAAAVAASTTICWLTT